MKKSLLCDVKALLLRSSTKIPPKVQIGITKAENPQFAFAFTH